MLESFRRCVGLTAVVMSLALVGDLRAAAAPLPTLQLIQVPSLDALESAMTARVDVLNGLGSPAKAQKKEAKALGKGLKQFAKYAGLDDKKDFKTLGKVASAISKSKTPDADILAQVEAVRDTIEDAGLMARQLVVSTEVLLMDAKTLAKVGKLVTKGDKLREKGDDLWPVNRGKGAKKLAAATAAFRKAAVGIEKKHVEEADEFPNDARPTGITLQTTQPEINHPIIVDAHYSLDRAAPDLTLALYANSVRSVPDGNGGMEPATQWLIGQQTLMDVPAGAGTHRFQREIPLWMERQEIVKGPVDPTDTLTAYDVDVDADTVALLGFVAGGSQRRVTLYERDAGGFGDWGQAASFVLAGTFNSIALSGDTLAVGGVSGTETVLVFERNEGGAGAWGQTAELMPADTSDAISFGQALDISGDWIMVGASSAQAGAFSGAGALYTFRRDQGGAGAWGQVARLTDPNGSQSLEGFGYSVALDGDLMLVGAPLRDTSAPDSGDAWMYELSPGTNSWVAKFFLGSGNIAGAAFGRSVAVDGDTMVVGASGDDPFGIANAGSARVFTRPGFGDITVGPKLVSHNREPGDLLGYFVAVAEDLIAVTSFYDDNNKGSTYLYVRNQGGDEQWGQLERLASPFQDDPASFLFGWAVAAHGDVIVASANSAPGRAVIYSGMEPIIEGDYTFALQVDPHDRILERPLPAAEDNNLFMDPTPVRFEGEAINMPNLVLESVEVTPNVIFLDTEAKPAATFGINIKASLHGNFDGPLSGVGFVLGLGSEGLGAHYIPSTIWDAEQEKYVDFYEFPDMVVGEPIEMHLDVRFERDDINQANVGNFLVDMPGGLIAPSGLVEFNPANPDAGADNMVPLTSYPGLRVIEPVKCSFSESYVKGMGNSDFGARVDFNTSLDLTRDIPGAKVDHDITGLFPGSEAAAGVVAAVHGGINAQIMGLDVELVGFKTLVERDPIQNYGFLGSDLIYLDPTSFKKQVVYSVGPYDTIDLEKINKFPDGIEYDSAKGEISFTKTFQVSKRTEKQKTFFPGGIPVTIEGAVEGGIGFEMKLTVGNALVAEAYPFARLFGTIELDVAGGLVGAEGKLTLVDLTFRSAAGMGMEVVEDGLGSKAIDSALCFKVSAELVLLNGKLSVFARYPALKWCDTFFGDVPCGFRIRKASFEIVNWTAFTFCKTFVDEVEPLCCEWVVGQMRCPGDQSTICNSEACD